MHCMNRRYSSDTVEDSLVKQLDTGLFAVTSETDHHTTYHVSLEDDTGVPFCGCPDWERHHLPCKHMFAIFRCFPDPGWFGLPTSFRESPVLTLDIAMENETSCNSPCSEQLPVTNPTHNQCQVDSPEVTTGNTCNSSPCHSSNEHGYCEEEIPKHRKNGGKRQLKLRCREKLSLLREQTFLCHDRSALEHLDKELQKCILNINRAITCEAGLSIREAEPSARHKMKLKKPVRPEKRPRLIQVTGYYIVFLVGT